MNSKRAFEIVNNKEIYDVFYNNEPVWIQELNNNKATIGFMNFNEVENVNIEDLKEYRAALFCHKNSSSIVIY